MSEKDKFTDPGFVLVTISHALNHGYDGLLPVLYPSLISQFGLSYSLVGMMAMGFRLTSGAFQLIMGFLGRFVRRKVLLGFGLIWQSIANSFMGFSTGFNQILICRSLAGIGSSPQHPTGSSYIAETFSKKKIGKALGINIVAASVGRFVAPFAASLLLPVLGWRATILAFSSLGLIVGVGFLFNKEARRPANWSGKSSYKLLFKGLGEVLRSRIVLTVMVVETVMAFRAGIGDFLPTYFTQELGLTSLTSGLFFTVFLFSGLPAPYFWGYLSDRIERRKVVMLAMGSASILWFILPYVKHNFALIPVLIVLGFACQGVGGVIQAFVAEATNLENRDIIYGIYFTLAFTLGSLSPVIFGYLADTSGFHASFLYVTIVSLLAVFASYFLKEEKIET
jgi:FSR family fosmidomycin resistance protein-like MFS transporter